MIDEQQRASIDGANQAVVGIKWHRKFYGRKLILRVKYRRTSRISDMNLSSRWECKRLGAYTRFWVCARIFKHDFRERSYGQNTYQYPSGIITDYSSHHGAGYVLGSNTARRYQYHGAFCRLHRLLVAAVHKSVSHLPRRGASRAKRQLKRAACLDHKVLAVVESSRW